jgi:predicted lipoprotein with Yx(FWY)xxD motif
MKYLALATLSAAMLGGCATMADPAPAKMAGGMLTGPNGMTLYTYDRDVPDTGKSSCNGQCAVNWPPLMAADSAKGSGDYSVVTRDDGKKQWAMKGQPLYYWIKDTKAGDKTGDGVQNVWHIIKP